MSAWLPKVVEPSKQQVLAAVFFLILYPYYLIRASVTQFSLSLKHRYQGQQRVAPSLMSEMAAAGL